MIDVLIVGGGIIGLATAHSIMKSNPSKNIVILEKESQIAKHQSGHNSGVIHSGIYYKPGSLKAKNCRSGVSLLIKFCQQHGIPFDMCGKIIVATNDDELPILDMLYDRGKNNRISGLRKISKDEIKEIEPHVTGKAGIFCPETGIIDYSIVCETLSNQIKQNGRIVMNACVKKIIYDSNSIIVETEKDIYKSRFIINCAGLFSDKIAELSNIKRNMRIIPFRGEYYMLNHESQYLVNNLVYPVPNPNYPFLGTHFTKTIDGEVEVGPNAVLAWAREGYKKNDINLNEICDYFFYKGFWKMASKYWKIGIGEYYRSFFKHAFVKDLQRLIPDISIKDIAPSPSGVRAQALSPDGKLLDDFFIQKSDKMIHVFNSPSPAATSALSIGKYIANSYSLS